MPIGLAITIPILLTTGTAVTFNESDVLHLALSGLGNVGGLLLIYTALRRGKVALVGPIASTEGAIAATLAILAGDPLTASAAAVLAVIAVGIVLAAAERAVPNPDSPAPARRFWRSDAVGTAALALGGAILFGVSLYATSRIADLPVAWAILPARLAGFVGVTLPLLAMRRLHITRRAVPFVLWVGVAEVIGVATFTLGARESAAVTSVLASQFAGIAAIVAFLIFGERLSRIQVAGVVIIGFGVAALAGLHA
jgi:drug/metabolite transporter (DMT)-like permease